MAKDDPRDEALAVRVLLAALSLSALLWGCGHQPEAALAPQRSAPGEASAAELLRVAEVDPQLLDAGKQQRLLQLAQAQPCPCAGSEQSLSACALVEGSCVRARFAVRSIARGLDDDAEDKEIRERLVERFGPREPEVIPLAGTPCRGPTSAPVTLVVFSDFECPYCSLAARLSDRLLRDTGDHLRLCFKHYPLSSIHKGARLAAEAAVAAARQGKFWEMHDALYADQEGLDREGLLERAQGLGLDLARFAQDLASAETAATVERDLAEARRLGLQGTPTFFVNGREMTDPKSPEIFLDWIAEALALQDLEAKLPAR